jgi:hypothetical protein
MERPVELERLRLRQPDDATSAAGEAAAAALSAASGGAATTAAFGRRRRRRRFAATAAPAAAGLQHVERALAAIGRRPLRCHDGGQRQDAPPTDIADRGAVASRGPGVSQRRQRRNDTRACACPAPTSPPTSLPQTAARLPGARHRARRKNSKGRRCDSEAEGSRLWTQGVTDRQHITAYASAMPLQRRQRATVRNDPNDGRRY